MDQQTRLTPPEPVIPTDGAAVHCPLCEYDLRGLIEPRCPECGYRFDWAELLDPGRQVHLYLFEQYPKRNIRAFYRTVLGGLRPRRFWKSLQPQHTSRPRRLLMYWVLCTLIPFFIGVLLLGAFELAADFVSDQSSVRFQQLAPTWSKCVGDDKIAHAYAYHLWFPGVHSRPYSFTVIAGLANVAPALVYSSLMLALWTGCTFLSLMIFQKSMSRAQVKRIHVARCVLYSFDVGVWVGFIMLCVLPMQFFALVWGAHDALALALQAALVFGAYRLWIAYRSYLRFDHALAVVLSTQVITALVFALIYVALWSNDILFHRLSR